MDAEVGDQLTGGGVDEALACDDDGRHGLVSVGVLANRGGIVGVVPDVVLDALDAELVERIVVMCNRGITYLRAFNVIAIIKKIKRRPMVSLAFPESA